mmetsp:Transcript_12611/g.27607  ORF Transcript_12611/g.27607 Transcript_12611/m.27607 type:complete len:321 (+) Transcript_12611:226-1188(+)
MATVSVLTITSNIVYGKSTGSTPDGRLMGEPFGPGANPMHNRDTNGALASLSSVAKLPYASCMDGISNTFGLTPTALGSLSCDRGKNLVSLLDGYFGKNGHHLNINVLNRKLLEDAHIHPEKYPDLTIRVSGYAVRFNQLTPEQRKEVLMRTMHGSATTSNPSKTSTVATRADSLDIEDLDDLEPVVQSNSGTVAKGTAVHIGSVHSLETFTSNDGPGVRTLGKFLCLYCTTAKSRCNTQLLFVNNSPFILLPSPFLGSNPDAQCIVDPLKFPEVAVSDEEVIDVLKRYEQFLSPNSGGVTFSGGVSFKHSCDCLQDCSR